MFIKDKLQSYQTIKALNLNITDERIFHKGQQKEVKEYLNNNVFKYYVLRDKSDAASKLHRYKVTKDEVLKYIDDYKVFSIAESSLNFEHHRILCGEILIDSDWNLTASLDDGKEGSVRDCMYNPKYKYNFSVLDGYEPPIKGLKQVIDYIFIHKLLEIVVEFSLYDIPVGINKENIIIWELRNY